MKGTEIRSLSGSLAETHALAGRLAEVLRDRLVGSSPELRSVLIGLDGALGAGKTAFVQGFVARLDSDHDFYVTSPTFALVQEYPTVPRVTHIDLYRLTALEDLEAIGYRELYDSPGVTLVEWASRVPEALPAEWIEIALAVLPSDVREIVIRPHGDRLLRVVEQALG